MSKYPLYPSNLLPAANVSHCYRNCWIRDMYFVGICQGGEIKNSLWKGMIGILDTYSWKLKYHARVKPKHWYEYIHVRYSPEGNEIDEGWRHNQWDSIGNWLEVCIDSERIDLAELLVDYLDIIQFYRAPAAGAWEDRHVTDAYSLAACIDALSKAKPLMPEKRCKIEFMVRKALNRLYSILPHATSKQLTCMSLLGVIWPYNMAGPFKKEIIDNVKNKLMREPFGFIRYESDSYDGEFMNRGYGTETPWLLGDCFMNKIEPENTVWRKRIESAYSHFGCLPEAFYPESMKPNRNTPLIWAEAMWDG